VGDFAAATQAEEQRSDLHPRLVRRSFARECGYTLKKSSCTGNHFLAALLRVVVGREVHPQLVAVRW
jgi:hypothetical protein